MRSILEIQQRLKPLRDTLTQHKVYSLVSDAEDLRVFMQHHVFAVWDFMSLLKALQLELTCVRIPWTPVGDPALRFLINEIVLGEESDVDPNGGYISHFELYLRAMEQAKIDTKPIFHFIQQVMRSDVNTSLLVSEVPEGAKTFVEETFRVINSNKPWLMAAVFTFGREDLIPEMFIQMVSELNKQEGQPFSWLQYYLERHIEVDGEHHSILALKMTEMLCGEDESRWEEACQYAELALKARIGLWDSICEKLNQKHYA